MTDRRYFMLSPKFSEDMIEEYKEKMAPIKKEQDEFIAEIGASFLMVNELDKTILTLVFPKRTELPSHLSKKRIFSYEGKPYLEAVTNRRYKEGKALAERIKGINKRIARIGSFSSYVVHKLNMYREIFSGRSLAFSAAGIAYEGGPVFVSVPIKPDASLEDFNHAEVKELKQYQYTGLTKQELTPEEVWNYDRS